MADEVINIDLIIQTAKSAKSLKDIQKSLQDLKSANKSITKDSKDYDKLTQAIADTALQGAAAASNFRDMRQSVKDLRDAMEQLGPQSKQFTVLNQAAGKLEHQMKGVSDAIKYTSGAPLHNLSAGFHGLRDSILNLDFEEAGVALKALGGNMKSLASGALKNLQDRFKSFGGGITNIFKGIGKAIGGDLKGGLKAAGDGFKGLGNALKVNPIFLIVGVIALIITKFDELKHSGGLIGKLFSAIGDAIGWVIDKLKALSDFFGITDLAAQKSAQDQLELIQRVSEEEDKAFDNKMKIASAEGALAKSKAKSKAEELKAEKQTAYTIHQLELQKLFFAQVSAKEQIKALEQIQAATGPLTDEQQKQYDELTKSLNQIAVDIKDADLKYAATANDFDKQITANAEEEAKKRQEKLKQIKEEGLKELEKQEQIDINNTKENTEDRVAEEKSALDETYAYSVANAKALGLNSNDLVLLYQENIEKKKKLDDDYQTYTQEEEAKAAKKKEDADAKKAEELQKISDLELKLSDNKVNKYTTELSAIQDIYTKEKDALDDALDHGLISIDQYNTDVLKMNKQLADEDAKINAEEQKEKTKQFLEYTKKVEEMQSTLFDSLGGLADAFAGKSRKGAEEAFKINKGLSLATATVKGVESVVNAIADNPFPLNIALAAAAGAAAVSNIAKIESTKFDPGGSSSGGGSKPSVPSTSTPSLGTQSLMQVGTNTPLFNGVPGTNNSTSTSTSSGNSEQPGGQVVKAYVVSSDIESSTNKSQTLAKKTQF